MHIPACETRQLEILTFQQAMEHRDQSAEYDRSRWLYIPDFYSEYRYILGTVGKRPLITIGINPSTAAPDALDNTLKSVQRIALGNGFDSFIMFNVYAQRATNPDQMDKEFNEPLHRENMNAFRWVLERSGELADAELEHRIADFLLYRYDKGLSLYANLEKAREMCS